TLADFLKDFIFGIGHLIAHPLDLVKGIGALIELISKAIFAAIPLPRTFTVEGIVDAYLPFLTQQFPGTLFNRDDVIKLIREKAPPEFIQRLDHQTDLEKKMFQAVVAM